MNDIELRSLELYTATADIMEVRATPAEGNKPATLVGYASVFNSLSADLGGGFRERVLAGSVVPTIADSDPTRAMAWSIFGLSCVAPAGYELVKHQLQAGDLALSFASGRRELLVRQVTLAQTALSRMGLDKWLAQQEWRRHRHFRARGEPRPVEIQAGGRTVFGIARTMPRALRFRLGWWLPAELTTYALHDPLRDKLVLAQTTDPALAEEALRTVGWADGARPAGTEE